jgi:hypothetical protein
MITKEKVFEEVEQQGYITERQIYALKRISNRLGTPVYRRSTIKRFKSTGIPVTCEQGEKGLAWLKKMTRKRVPVVDERTKEIILNSKPSDFHLYGFKNVSTNFFVKQYEPIYEINGLIYQGCYGSIEVM